MNPEPFTVVVVDDDPFVVRLVAALLRSANVMVHTCMNGAEGLRVLSTQHWDLLLLDRQLPDMDGSAICAHVKAAPGNELRRVIMLTGRTSLSDKVEGFAAGADDYVTKPFHPLELEARVKAAQRGIELQKELAEANRRLEELSVRDGLTGTFNRRHLSATLEWSFRRAVRYARPLSIALLDVDAFKQINDSRGHQAGDKVLAEVAGRFANAIRSSDYLARYGGEEFMVVLPDIGLDDALVCAEKLRRVTAEAPFLPEASPLAVTVSAGVASIPYSELRSSEELVSAADRALYRAKANGRNRVEVEKRRSRERVLAAGQGF